MSDKDLITFPNNSSQTRAKSFKVKSAPHNYSQYVRTVKAYALAGMSFKDIANAGDILGDEVERNELDTLLQNSIQSKVGEVIEDDSQILAWQAREKVSTTHQLTSANPVTGNEMVVVSKDVITVESAVEQTIDVVEGIKVVREEVTSLPNPSTNQNLENNPYLKILPENFKK